MAEHLNGRDIFGSWWRWLFFAHANYNEEGFQSTGFAHALSPVIRKLYHEPAEIRAALKRHLVLFSTDPEIGGLINGMTIALEEQRASGDRSVDEAAIQRLKTNLMGPLGAVGDTIKQGLWLPIWLAVGIGISLSAAGTPAAVYGPLLFSLVTVGYTVCVGWLAYYHGYRRGPSLVAWLLQRTLLDDMRLGGAVLGTGMFAVLGARFVKLQIPDGWGAFMDQAPTSQRLWLENVWSPLPALAVMLVLIWLLRRGVSAAGITLCLFGLAFATALLAAVARVATQSGPLGLFSAPGLPALMGIVLLAVGAYVVGRREQHVAVAWRLIGLFLMLAVLVSMVSAAHRSIVL